MSRSITKVLPAASVGSAGTTTVATLPIGCYSNFDITIRVSSSTGMVYEIDTAPVNDDIYFLSATNGAVVAGTCATLRHEFRDNNQMYLKITGSATATVSASNIRIILTSVERF
jgi:hypothetical protein